VREKLYLLNEGGYNTKIVDLGNIARGETVVDTYFALKNRSERTNKKRYCPLIIGGGQDLTYAQYLGYGALWSKRLTCW
jgi:formiminoglutamase